MKNNLLTQVKRVHYSIKSMYDSSRNQMVELQDQPTTWSEVKLSLCLFARQNG